jgi:hypothetical protein
MLCGILLIQLKLGSLAYNFNFRKYVLINYESCVGAFLLQPYYLIYIIFTLAYHLFTALAEYQP